MDRDELRNEVAAIIGRAKGIGTWHDYKTADDIFAALEAAGYVLMPKDQILRKMSHEEFTEMMAGIRFKENGDG